MTQFSKTQFSFAGGIFSPSMYGRSDLERWVSALSVMDNFVARPEGPASRRSGTRFVTASIDESTKTRLIPFVFSSEDAYILEFSEFQVRVLKDEGILQDSGQIFNGPVLNTGDVVFDGIGLAMKYRPSIRPINVINISGGRIQNNGVDIEDDDVFYVGDWNGAGTVTLYEDVDFAVEVNFGPNLSGVNTNRLQYVDGFGFAIPYSEDELCDVRFAQSADVMYLVHENHPPLTISRTAVDAFVPGPFVFENGPWRDENDEDGIEVFVSTIHSDDLHTKGADISITLTGTSLFDSTRDVDRYFQLWIEDADPMEYLSIQIKSVTTNQIIRGLIETPLEDDTPPVASTTATERWTLGRELEDSGISGEPLLPDSPAGWPRAVTFHQQRLWFGGSPTFPENIWSSRVGRFTDFSAFSLDNEVNDDDAITQTLGDNRVNAVQWMKSNRVLVIGTNGGIYNVDSDRAGDSLTANSIRAIRVNAKPCSSADAEVFETLNAYISFTGFKVRGSVYDLGSDSYRSDDLSIFSDSVLAKTAEELSYADEPHSQLHVRLGDGRIASLSFIGSEQVQGWNNVTMGGTFQGAGAFIESIATIPSPETVRNGIHVNYDQVWLNVRRTIDGVDRRYIEFFEEDFADGGFLDDAFFIDSGLSLQRNVTTAQTITGVTQASPAVVTTSAAHGILPNDQVRITHVSGMTELNNRVFFVGAVTATTFQLIGEDSTNFSAYVKDGEVRELKSSATGLDHLEGETVQIVGDGSVQQERVVSSGVVAVDPPASEVHIGLGYTSTMEQLPLDQNTQQGSGMGFIKRITHVVTRLKDTVGGKVGELDGNQTRLKDRQVGDVLDATTGLKNGWQETTLGSGYSTEGRVAVIQDEPMPMTVVAITRRAETVTR